MSFSYPPRGKTAAPLRVLSDVNLEVGPSDFVSIIGPSGCGKTTLVRILAGLIPAEQVQGEVTVAGRPILSPPPEIGFVFQNVALIPWRSVRKNVAFSIEMRNRRRPTRDEWALVDEVIDLVGLADFRTYFPSQLSGGMQQRVGVARALVLEPQLLLMDEPFGALDAQTRRLFHEELLKWRAARPFAAVLVTHDLDEALFLSDRVIVMSARPARILEEMVVSWRRSWDGRADPRIDEDYRKGEVHLWELLRQENVAH